MTQEFHRRQLPDNSYEILAAIIERDDGGPMRPIATGRRRRVVGSYYSFKCGHASPWESRNELHALYHAEVRFDVVVRCGRALMPEPQGDYIDASPRLQKVHSRRMSNHVR